MLTFCMHILYTVLYKFPKVLTKRNFFNHQELLELVTISDILVILMCDQEVISEREI